MTVYRAATGSNTSGSPIIDDGTNYLYKVGSTTLFGIRKSDNQMLGQAGFDADQTL